MPRIACFIAPGYPHHITQRGNNPAMAFLDDEDRQIYLKLLAIYPGNQSLRIWAYCLMENHIHLLAVPKTPTALPGFTAGCNRMSPHYPGPASLP